jgi:xanthine dehydrogenase accessory factor
MKEIKSIVKAYNGIDKIDTHAALATVVRVEGSSYRRTGARMLVLDNGTWIGGISGGCLEGDALKRARLAINNSRSTLITYDTTEDDPHQIGVGLGCNGIIDVLFTPLDYNDKNNPVEILKNCVEASRETHVLITITNLSGGWANLRAGQVIKYCNSESLEVFDDKIIELKLHQAVDKQLDENKSAPVKLAANDKAAEVFIEILPPEISVVLMGHQYDIYSMSRLLKELGWRVTIVADLLKINPQIRPFADEIVNRESFGELTIDHHTAVILMSHDYNTDKKNLVKALSTQAGFIGILGPRVRSEKMWRELAEEGNPVKASDQSRIFAPVGLDIGAVTPEEIALSMAAGVKAAFSNRTGEFLKFRDTPIHPRD